MVLYADLIFIVNTFMNYLILRIDTILSGTLVRWYRLMVAAAVGGIYAVLCCLSQFSWLNAPFFQLLSPVLICIIAFGISNRQQFFRKLAVFYMGAFLLAGGITALQNLTGGNTGFLIFAATSVAAYVLIGLSFRGEKSVRDTSANLHRAGIRLGQQAVSITVLHDTGNCLSDPMTNRSVMLVQWSAVRTLFPTEAVRRYESMCAGNAAGCMTALNEICPDVRFLLVPFRSIGTMGGMLLAFVPDALHIDQKAKQDHLIGIAPPGVLEQENFQGIIRLK